MLPVSIQDRASIPLDHIAAAGDWSSLPPELINRIADCFLATSDLDYYMDFRAVCGSWRSATDDPKNTADLRFRPRRWIVIDEVFQSRHTRLLVNTATGRSIHKDLPLLRHYDVITSTPDGLFVMADRRSSPAPTTRVLNPFTGSMIHFMAPMTSEEVAAAAVTGLSRTLFLFCDSCRKLCVAAPDRECFDVYGDRHHYPYIRLAVLADLYGGGEHEHEHDELPDVANKIMSSFAVQPSEMLAIYPTSAEAGHTNRCFLVESDGEMLVILKLHLQQRVEIFKMDIDERNELELKPVKSIGNRAIFLGYCRCLSVNADKFPSVDADCVYYLNSLDLSCDIYMYDLKEEKEEMVSPAISSLNPNFLFADPPFTIIQLLSSYTSNDRNCHLAMEQRLRELPDDIIPSLSPYLEDMDFDYFFE